MSVEKKIAALLEAVADMKKATPPGGEPKEAGDVVAPAQGSSAEAEYDELDTDAPGKDAAAKMAAEPKPAMQGDAASVKTQAQEAVDMSAELSTIFGEDLSEEFKTKATSIFEAAVIARVNNEMEKVTAALTEQHTLEISTFKETLTEQVDTYLNYIVEQWMQDNKLAIEAGLRTEITEDFIGGLKTLFAEHYINIPEEKYEVIDEMQDKINGLETKLNEAMAANAVSHQELVQLTRHQIFEEISTDLAVTEKEKFAKLIEGVEFGTADLFQTKLEVIKENYFPKTSASSPEKKLEEDVVSGDPVFASDSIARYVQAISRQVAATK